LKNLTALKYRAERLLLTNLLKDPNAEEISAAEIMTAEEAVITEETTTDRKTQNNERHC
jgi:hypothetical protein